VLLLKYKLPVYVFYLGQLSSIETAKQVTLITSDPWMLCNRSLSSWQEFSEDIQGEIKKYDLY